MKKHNPTINYIERKIFFDSCNYRKKDEKTKIMENPKIEEISMAAIIKYYEENPDSVFAILTIKKKLIVFTLP